MPICFNRKLTFIHIPKCAGTSITKILRAGSTNDLYSQKTIAQLMLGRMTTNNQHGLTTEQYQQAVSKTPQHLTAYELMQLFPDYPKPMFTIVRNPFERLVSEYSFVLQEIEYKHDLRYINVRKGFDYFVRWGLSLPVDQRIAIFDGHLETQMSYVTDPNTAQLLIGNVFRYENLQPCFDFIQQFVSWTVDRDTVSKKSLHGHYSTYYTKTLVDCVAEFYHSDLQTLQYQYS